MLICESSVCIGCGVCKAVCPRDAILLAPNAEGFLTPRIDAQRCTQCGLCQRACPQNQNMRSDFKAVKRIFAFKHPNAAVRKGSSSGAAFPFLAEQVLKNGGSVYGAALSADQTVVHHICAKDEQTLRSICGSKYVQSSTEDSWEMVGRDLKCGRSVLFSGTACQVYALLKYLEYFRIPTENLLTCDVICHGVGSPGIYAQYLAYVGKKHHSAVKTYHFRSKEVSWRGASATAVLDNGKTLRNTPDVSSYMNVYYSGCITRECCYSCRFAQKQRVADCTIGDFWGLERLMPEFEDALGVSVILGNTDKAVALLLQTDAAVEMNVALEALKQPNLLQPTARPTERDAFWNEYRKKDIGYVLHKYGAYGIWHKLDVYRSALKRKLKIK